jgi:hypothetical protein
MFASTCLRKCSHSIEMDANMWPDVAGGRNIGSEHPRAPAIVLFA